MTLTGGCAVDRRDSVSATPDTGEARWIKRKSHYLRLRYTGDSDGAGVCAALLGEFAQLITPRPVGHCTAKEFMDVRSGLKFYAVQYADGNSYEGHQPSLSYTLDTTAEYCDRLVFMELGSRGRAPIRILVDVVNPSGMVVGGQPVQTLPKECRHRLP